MDKRITVLEEIVQDIQTALFQKWANAVPESERNEETPKTSSLEIGDISKSYIIVRPV